MGRQGGILAASNILWLSGAVVVAGVGWILSRSTEKLLYISPIAVNVLLSLFGCIMTYQLITVFTPLLIKAGMSGIDLNKDPVEPPKKVASPGGVIAGAVFLIVLFLFIPFPFVFGTTPTSIASAATARATAVKSDVPALQSIAEAFPHAKFAEFICALLSICCMIFLGFVDDVIDLRWRHKLILPTIATLPLLMVYMVNIGSTSIVVPIPLRGLFGHIVDMHLLYYIYMGMLAVFCTNAINILAGINGVEAGQSLIIAISIAANNILQLTVYDEARQYHLFSLYFILPFIGVTVGLLMHNWYPSNVFVGDTFCYFAGMTFAVVGILGHFSKTMMLFFIPQIINFVYSTPQLFHAIPCPRHRLPKYNRATKLCGMSTVSFNPDELSTIGKLVYKILVAFNLVWVNDQRRTASSSKQDLSGPVKMRSDNKTAAAAAATDVSAKPASGEQKEVEINNLTIINGLIRIIGPTSEQRLTVYLLLFQLACSAFAFSVRYWFVRLVYEEVR